MGFHFLTRSHYFTQLVGFKIQIVVRLCMHGSPNNSTIHCIVSTVESTMLHYLKKEITFFDTADDHANEVIVNGPTNCNLESFFLFH